MLPGAVTSSGPWFSHLESGPCKQSLPLPNGTHGRSITNANGFILGDWASQQLKDLRYQYSLLISPDWRCPGSLTPSYQPHLYDGGPMPSPTRVANLPGLLTWAPVLEGKGSYRNEETHSPDPQGAPWSMAKIKPTNTGHAKCNTWGLCQRSRTVDTRMVRRGGCRSCSEEGFLG